MTKTLADYLGKSASTMLADSPFKFWPVDKSVEYDLPEPIGNYIFVQHGMEVRCDQFDQINAIFIYTRTPNDIDERPLEFPLSLTRKDVIALLGSPSETGGGINVTDLGRYGAFDRFARVGYAVHVEYKVDTDKIRMVTLMRPDTVPP